MTVENRGPHVKSSLRHRLAGVTIRAGPAKCAAAVRRAIHTDFAVSNHPMQV